MKLELKQLNDGLNIKKDVFFSIGYCLLLFVLFFKETMFKMPSVLNKTFFAVAILCFLFKIIFLDSHRIMQIVLILVSAIIGGLTYWYSHDFELLLLVLCLFATKDVQYANIIKIHFFLVGVCLLVVAAMTVAGIIPNIQFFRDGSNRLAMGMTYATVLASFMFFLVLDYIVLRSEKINILDGMLVFFIASLVFKLTDTRSIVYLLMTMSFVIVLFSLFKKTTKKCFFGLKYFWFALAALVPVLTIYLSYTFNYSQNIYIELNRLLTGRLALSKEAFLDYKITPFGQIMSFYGLGGGIHYTLANTYFYLDSLPMYVLMKYGVLSILYYYAIQIGNIKKAFNKKQFFLALCFVLITLYEFIDNKTFRVAFNPFFLLLYSNLSNNNNP